MPSTLDKKTEIIYDITITFKSGTQISFPVKEFNVSKDRLGGKSYEWIDAFEDSKLMSFDADEVAAIQSRRR